MLCQETDAYVENHDMKKQKLTPEQKRLDIDIWVITLVTMAVFSVYVVTGNPLMSFVKNSEVSVILRLLLN